MKNRKNLKKTFLWLLVFVILLSGFYGCSLNITSVSKKIVQGKTDEFRVKGMISKIFFLDDEKIFLYELKDAKDSNTYALLLSDKKYKKGDKLEIVVETFRIMKSDYESSKDTYWNYMKSYILKKTIYSNTEIILLLRKIELIIKQYIEKEESVLMMLDLYTNTGSLD
ncbi:MAG: hypothetical protein KBG82_03390 [Spirochaetes bacterium]|nr:hypothetical protein [Spirochaetota bacterium]MBP8991000.1 hypothetical protein [Spirochaetota bacterium]NLJ05404.1 hypothetical protein [Exilispira sp.]HOV46769.1 hypothetical protein [Exilispira sp.]